MEDFKLTEPTGFEKAPEGLKDVRLWKAYQLRSNPGTLWYRIHVVTKAYRIHHSSIFRKNTKEREDRNWVLFHTKIMCQIQY